jgi:hypothetical protein
MAVDFITISIKYPLGTHINISVPLIEPGSSESTPHSSSHNLHQPIIQSVQSSSPNQFLCYTRKMANHKVTPADMVSVQSNSISYLYFVNQKGFVSSLRSNSSNGVEAESAGFYKKESVNVTKKDADDNEVTVPVKTHTDLKQIAAVAYKDNQERYQVHTSFMIFPSASPELTQALLGPSLLR